MSYQPGRRGAFRLWLAIIAVLVMLAAAVCSNPPFRNRVRGAF